MADKQFNAYKKEYSDANITWIKHNLLNEKEDGSYESSSRDADEAMAKYNNAHAGEQRTVWGIADKIAAIKGTSHGVIYQKRLY
jgi:hypothetical protein